MNTLSNATTRLGIGLIHVYRKTLSPLFAGSCRYEPSCSVYAEQAIQKYGILKGSWMGAKRIASCGPWRPGGYDPVK
ncbi:MAG: membrane protein insertion efficiency factor YidD [Chloroflexota bacterium]|nr:membrane protein insertion efficiency factor YidD [Chloroflexota bacterium]